MFFIRRVTLTPTGPTFGVFLNESTPLCVTLELPDLNNTVGKSCILPGVYQVIQNTQKKPWRLLDVPGRTEVDIHDGNTIADTEGCILVGTYFYSNGIIKSNDAVDYLKSVLPLTFPLTVVNP